MFDIVQPVFSRRVFTAVLLILTVGCGGGDPGPERFDISGTVSFDGQPIAAGQVLFIPDSKKGNSGPATTAIIESGSFTTAGHGKGVVGGPHRVRVSGFDGQSTGGGEESFGTPLFPEYELNLDLPTPDSVETETHTVDIQVPKEAATPKRIRPEDRV